jgi:hypothetical protein
MTALLKPPSNVFALPSPRSPSAVANTLRRSLVSHLANAEDESSGEGYEVFEFEKKKVEEPAIVGIRRDLARDPVRVERQLRKANLDTQIGDVGVRKTVAAAVTADPAEHWLYSAHLGWRGEFGLAVLNDSVLGQQDGKRTVKPPLWVQHHLACNALRRRGTSEGWLEGVATRARHSTSLILGILAALAGPALRVLGMPPLGFDFSRGTAADRALLALVAGSVAGFAPVTDLPDGSTTDRAFQAAARPFNDATLLVRDLAARHARPKARLRRVRQLRMPFSATPPRQQPDFTAKSVVQPREWCGVVLSISRRKLAEDLGAAGLADDPQLVNPWHELPIVAGEDGTLFDLATARHQASQQWCERQAAALTRDAGRHRGHALRLMFQALIDLRDDARRKLEGWVAVFIESLPVKLRHRLPESTVREFGALYATGRLAIAAGILDWRRQRLLRTVTSGLSAAHPGSVSLKTRVRQLLYERLCEMSLPLKSFKGELSLFPDQGFRTQGTDCDFWWINAEHFRSWFSDQPEEVETALRLLFDANRLILPSHFAHFPGVAFVEHQLKWNPRARKKTGFYKLAVGRR